MGLALYRGTTALLPFRLMLQEGDFGLLAIASIIIHYLEWQAGNNFGSFAPYCDYPLAGCSREMRPLAFLEPSTFLGTNPTLAAERRMVCPTASRTTRVTAP